MASSPRLTSARYEDVVLRLSEPAASELLSLMFRRYPAHEWATFARFGWKDGADRLVLTLAGLNAPKPNELDESVGHVAFQEPYSLRTALEAESGRLAVGVVHSHPAGARPAPSSIDDDMDAYYASYFADFAPGRPYVSLIISLINDKVVLSGRVFFRSEWVTVSRLSAALVDESIELWRQDSRKGSRAADYERVARLVSAFGESAARRLSDAAVAVIGAGGTGSAAVEVLARAGVGRLVIVDPDTIVESNLERMHGSVPGDVSMNATKVAVAAKHIRSLNPSCKVEAVVGRIPQAEVVSAIAGADVALGCTDQQHSRLALSDITVRYLVPSLDCGVALEGEGGKVSGQIMQFVKFAPHDPCIVCRRMVDPVRVTQELMSDKERHQRRLAAREATNRGEDQNAYWHDLPQLNTVGYLTTAAGAMAAGYAIGWLTRRFKPPFDRLQMNWSAKFLDVTDVPAIRDPECTCGSVLGWADQAPEAEYVSIPSHWPAAQKLNT